MLEINVTEGSQAVSFVEEVETVTRIGDLCTPLSDCGPGRECSVARGVCVHESGNRQYGEPCEQTVSTCADKQEGTGLPLTCSFLCGQCVLEQEDFPEEDEPKDDSH